MILQFRQGEMHTHSKYSFLLGFHLRLRESTGMSSTFWKLQSNAHQVNMTTIARVRYMSKAFLISIRILKLKSINQKCHMKNSCAVFAVKMDLLGSILGSWATQEYFQEMKCNSWQTYTT